MVWPVVALTVPSALLGLAGLAAAFLPWLQTADPIEWTGEYVSGAVAPEPLLADQTLVHIGAFMVVPLVAVAAGVALAWWGWRADAAGEPARLLGPARPLFANGFFLDKVQDALIVRPVRALAATVRRGDEGIVDGAVEGTGRGVGSLGDRVARAHHAGMPRAATAVLAAAVLLGAGAAVWGVMS